MKGTRINIEEGQVFNRMIDNRRIGIAIPSYNRVQMTLDSFADVYDDYRVKEIIIVDDASDLDKFNELKEKCSLLEKVKLYRNEENRDCYANKFTAIAYSNCDWNILLDSDNKIGVDYIDKLYDKTVWDDQVIYTPSFAAPQFDFRAYEGMIVRRNNVSEYVDKPLFEVMLNAANFFVNRQQYISIWDDGVDPVTSDSVFFTYKWLEANNVIYVVEGLQYFHRVWEGSHYKNNVMRTPEGFHESVLNKLRELA